MWDDAAALHADTLSNPITGRASGPGVRHNGILDYAEVILHCPTTITLS
jgi:hypothetical protein